MIPRDRAHTMSIGVAARFKLTLRQMDIIGEWAPIGAKRKLPAAIVTLDVPANDPTEQWAGFFTWENTAGWRWCKKTSKPKDRAAQDRARSYRTGSSISLSRPAARPKSGIWTRAGGATEAEEAGALVKMIQGASPAQGSQAPSRISGQSENDGGQLNNRLSESRQNRRKEV